MPVRLYTLAEANALVPILRDRLSEAQRVVAAMREAKAQLDDLVTVYGEALGTPACPENDEWRRWKSAFQERREEIDDLITELARLGVQVKDVDQGLVDVYTDRAGSVVFLCWKMGEPEFGHWHTVEGGFSGRKPVLAQEGAFRPTA